MHAIGGGMVEASASGMGEQRGLKPARSEV